MLVTKRFVAYIDEAGDEGFGKLRSGSSTGQSKWLIIGGVLVHKKQDAELPLWRDEILEMFPNKQRRDLHFRNLCHAQKVATVEYLSQKPFFISCVCSNKITIASNPRYSKIFKQKGYLYNYLTRYLLERLTRAVKSWSSQTNQAVDLRVIFSRRGGTDYGSMLDYMTLMRDGRERVRPVRSIEWSVFDPKNIVVENHSKWAGLQLADVITSATASALEPNIYGHYEPRYANTLARRFLADKDGVLNTGLVLLPPKQTNPLCPKQAAFLSNLEKLWRAPGP